MERYSMKGSKRGPSFAHCNTCRTDFSIASRGVLASYPGSLIIVGKEKGAWFQSLTYAPIVPEFWGESILQ